MDYARKPEQWRGQSGGSRPPRPPGRWNRLIGWLREHNPRLAAILNLLSEFTGQARYLARRSPRLATGLIVLLCVTALGLGGRYWWQEMRWRYILIHHTASDIGNLDYYRKFHVEQRGWSDIAYHFIVNNGSMNTTIGQIEESDLWKARKANLSTRSWYANWFGIAVVMVGNFERHPPAPLQQEALVRLLANLSSSYNIPPERIVGHREIQNTACPGKHLDMHLLREAVRRQLKGDPDGLSPQR